MDARTMPLATFRCDTCALEETLRLSAHLRFEGIQDIAVPHPAHDGHPMRIVQIQYADAVAAS